MNEEYVTDIYDTQTENGDWIRVYECGGAWQSAVYLDEDRQNELVFPYMRRFNHAFSINRNIRDILLIGGAGYVWPASVCLSHPSVHIDVADIDPDAYEAAREWFFLPETDNITPIVSDGRKYLEHTEKQYDLIVDDAFSGKDPVYSLHTAEALGIIFRRLSECGIYCANLPGTSSTQDSEFLQNAYRTACQVFPYVIVTDAYSPLSESDTVNYVLFCARVPIRTDDMVRMDDQAGKVLRDSQERTGE